MEYKYENNFIKFLRRKRKKDYIEKWKDKICFIIKDDDDIAIYSAEQLEIPVFLFGNKQDKKGLPSPLVTYVKSWYKTRSLFSRFI